MSEAVLMVAVMGFSALALGAGARAFFSKGFPALSTPYSEAAIWASFMGSETIALGAAIGSSRKAFWF